MTGKPGHVPGPVGEGSDGNQRAAVFIRDLTWDALPAAVREKIKLCFLDALGAAISGAMAHISEVTARFAAHSLPGNEATILFGGSRASAAGAAFANATAANAFDSDDIGQYTRGHPGAQIIPTALAMAEKHGKNGRETLTAMVVGYEIAHRMGRCWHDDHEVYQACGSWGTVANAAIAAHVMGLDELRIQHALGIADYHAPNVPMMRDIAAPAMVKHGIGWSSVAGVMAAQLAGEGFTGIPSLLGSEKYAPWMEDLGQHYILVDGAIFKEYACCGWGHTALDATRLLIDRHGLKPGAIEHMRVSGFHELVLLGSRLPTNTEEAQFSTGWPMTMLLLDGEVGPRQLLPERFADPVAVDLISRIELVESPEYNHLATLANFGDATGGYFCDVEVRLKDGSVLSSGRVVGANKYTQHWTVEQVEQKFRWLTELVLPASVVDQVTATILGFDQVNQVSDLINLVLPPLRRD